MTGVWLDWTRHRDLSANRGNGPFPDGPRGVVLHVNASGRGSQGTSADWYAAGGGPDSVCPTFQVMRDGTTWQFLPLDWEPWTQADGNSWGASIETGGDPSEPLSPEQVAACGRIMAAYHQHLDVPLQVTNSTSGRGLGVHSMGGAAWGGHPCPGSIRASQRDDILAAARGHQTGELTMDSEAKAAFAALNHRLDQLPAAVWNQELNFQPGTKNALRAKASVWVTYANRYALSGIGGTLSRARKLFRQEAGQ